jgi:hypothetical protein
MLCNLKARSVKPNLERLEGRDLPSFLFGGAINTLAAPLNRKLADMQTEKNDLTTVQARLVTDVNAITGQHTGQHRPEYSRIAQDYGRACADFRQMVVDQRAIKDESTQDVAFVNAAAMAEAFEGDATDFILLNFGSLFGFGSFTNALTSPVSTADSTVQSVNTIVNRTYTNVGGKGGQTFNLPSIASQALNVPFGF